VVSPRQQLASVRLVQGGAVGVLGLESMCRTAEGVFGRLGGRRSDREVAARLGDEFPGLASVARRVLLGTTPRDARDGRD
jgi:hypothetical protein